MLSDYKMHVLGVSDNSALGAYDPGADHRFAFRTPSLRNLRDTAPYMHSGVVADVSSVIGFYRTVGAGGAAAGGAAGGSGAPTVLTSIGWDGVGAWLT